MAADFQFYLNTQGLRGRTGPKGDDGFAPIITVGQNTLNTFTLMITTAEGTFETPNLRGSIINNAGAGTYLRYDAETDSIYLSELQTASETKLGGVTIATEDELANAAGTGVITADNMGAGIYGALKAGNNVALTLDEETGLVTISSTDTKYTLPVATIDTLGGVKPDGTTITITNDGTISSVGGGEAIELPVPRIGLTEVNVTNKPYAQFSREGNNLRPLFGVGGNYAQDNIITCVGDVQGDYKVDVKNGAMYFPLYLDIPIKKNSATVFPDTLSYNFNNKVNTILLGKNMGDGYFKPILAIGVDSYSNTYKCMHNLVPSTWINSSGQPSFNVTGSHLAFNQIGEFLGYSGVPSPTVIVEWQSSVIRLTYVNAGYPSQQGLEVSTALVSRVEDIDTIRTFNMYNNVSTDITQIRQLETSELLRDNMLETLYPTGKQLTLDETSYKAWDVLLDNQTIQVNAEGQLVVNMDEIGGDVSALSARVTTLEGTVGTLETSVTDLEDSTGQLQTRVTNLENNIDGGVI